MDCPLVSALNAPILSPFVKYSEAWYDNGQKFGILEGYHKGVTSYCGVMVKMLVQTRTTWEQLTPQPDLTHMAVMRMEEESQCIPFWSSDFSTTVTWHTGVLWMVHKCDAGLWRGSFLNLNPQAVSTLTCTSNFS